MCLDFSFTHTLHTHTCDERARASQRESETKPSRSLRESSHRETRARRGEEDTTPGASLKTRQTKSVLRVNFSKKKKRKQSVVLWLSQKNRRYTSLQDLGTLARTRQRQSRRGVVRGKAISFPVADSERVGCSEIARDQRSSALEHTWAKRNSQNPSGIHPKGSAARARGDGVQERLQPNVQCRDVLIVFFIQLVSRYVSSISDLERSRVAPYQARLAKACQ